MLIHFYWICQMKHHTPDPDSGQLSFESVHTALGITLDEIFQALQVHLDFQKSSLAQSQVVFARPPFMSLSFLDPQYFSLNAKKGYFVKVHVFFLSGPNRLFLYRMVSAMDSRLIGSK